MLLFFIILFVAIIIALVECLNKLFSINTFLKEEPRSTFRQEVDETDGVLIKLLFFIINILLPVVLVEFKL